jgi:hypothetical protein
MFSTTSPSIWRCRHDMRLYTFTSDGNQSVTAFTRDRTGKNLPTIYAPWCPVNASKAMAIDSNADPVGRAVRRDGFFLINTRKLRAA